MIAITGASGYIGSHLTRRLVENGQSVRAVVRSREKATYENRLDGLDVEWVEADVLAPEEIDKAIAGATAVVHTVAIAIEKGRGTYEKINFQGTRNVLDAALRAGVTRFIYISQLGASPDLPYRFLASKGMGENYVTSSALAWTVFKPAVIWGPEDEFANSFARLLPLTPLIFPIIGDESSQFQPVWIEGVITSIQIALDNDTTIHQIYELAGPQIFTLEEIERIIASALNRRRKFIHFPMSLMRILVRMIEAVVPNPPVTSSLLELLAVSNIAANNSLSHFVTRPNTFSADNISHYMLNFRIRETLKKFFLR